MSVIRSLARLLSPLLVASLVVACATSVDDPIGGDLFADGSDAGVDARVGTDGGRPLPGSDSGARPDTSTPPTVDSGATDSAVGDDTSTPPPVVDAAPPVGAACPSANGKYTIAYFLAVAALPDGGSLPACPCPATACCYTPLGASPVCLSL
jgi:hypothetical protein